VDVKDRESVVPAQLGIRCLAEARGEGGLKKKRREGGRRRCKRHISNRAGGKGSVLQIPETNGRTNKKKKGGPS